MPLHAPIRARETLRESAHHGQRLQGLRSPDMGWQHMLMAKAKAEGEWRLDEHWRLNSWDGELVVGPAGTPLVRDTALVDTIRPLVRLPVAQIAARAARRAF